MELTWRDGKNGEISGEHRQKRNLKGLHDNPHLNHVAALLSVLRDSHSNIPLAANVS